MEEHNCYKKVLNDIINADIGLLLGRFDAKHGSRHFMHGVRTVMDFIAACAGDEEAKKFATIWSDNFMNSLHKENLT